MFRDWDAATKVLKVSRVQHVCCTFTIESSGMRSDRWIIQCRIYISEPLDGCQNEATSCYSKSSNFIVCLHAPRLNSYILYYHKFVDHRRISNSICSANQAKVIIPNNEPCKCTYKIGCHFSVSWLNSNPNSQHFFSVEKVWRVCRNESHLDCSRSFNIYTIH